MILRGILSSHQDRSSHSEALVAMGVRTALFEAATRQTPAPMPALQGLGSMKGIGAKPITPRWRITARWNLTAGLIARQLTDFVRL